MYFDFGLGGNTWAVTRNDSRSDELSLRDLRLALGIDTVIDGGGGHFLELAAATRRRLEYENEGVKRDLPDALLIRGGWRY